MSTNVDTSSKAASKAVVESSVEDPFHNCVPTVVPSAKEVSTAVKTAVWAKLYAAAGCASSAESTKKSVRCAVYTYLAKNGTSPSGEYPGVMITGSGHSLAGNAIPAAAGLREVRQFARSNGEEALAFFHATDVLTKDKDMIAKCETLGVKPSAAVGLVDFLDMAVGLTPAERDVQLMIKNYSIDRARRGRGGKSLEDVRQDGYNATLAANGPSVEVPAVNHNGW